MAAERLPPLLVFADDWGRHPSSCQHLIRQVRARRPVVWVNTIGTRRLKANAFTVRRVVEKLRGWRQGVRQVDEQMWVVDLPMLPVLRGRALHAANRWWVNRYLNGMLRRLGLSRPIVLTTLPYVLWMVRNVPRRGLVYYVTDDFAHWPGADRDALLAADMSMRGAADLVLPVSQSLLARYRDCAWCEYFPHGVDVEHFSASIAVDEVPRELAALPRPRIGFFGLIYEKLDFALLSAVAQRFSEGSLAMIGPVDYCDSQFARLPNVHLLGRQPYDQLPRWIAGLDVLLLPYVIDEMIRQSGPLKLRECLAAGKPTVSVDVPEVRLLEPHVRVGRDQIEFVAHVAAAVTESGDARLADARRQAVRQDGWDRRAEQLERHLAELCGVRGGDSATTSAIGSPAHA